MGCTAKLGYFSVPGAEARSAAISAMERLGISHLAKRSVNAISGGERQLVYIARTLLQDPKIIVMDEPTSALDFGNSLTITDLIGKLRDDGYTIVLTCHNPNYPFLFQDHTAAILPDHSLLFGRSEEILSDETLSAIYGVGIARVFLPEYDQYVCMKMKA